MSSRESEPPLRLEPRSSPRLAAWVLLIHGGAMAVLVGLPMPVQVVLVLAAGVVVSLIHALRRHVLRHGDRAVRALQWHADGSWSLVTADGVMARARLLPSSYVSPHLVVLNLRSAERGWFPIVLFPDALDRRSFRRLLVRLGLDRDRG